MAASPQGLYNRIARTLRDIGRPQHIGDCGHISEEFDGCRRQLTQPEAHGKGEAASGVTDAERVEALGCEVKSVS